MNSGFANANSGYSMGGSKPRAISQMPPQPVNAKPAWVPAIPDRIAVLMQNMRAAEAYYWINDENRTLDTSPGELFEFGGPASDIMTYPSQENNTPSRKPSNRNVVPTKEPALSASTPLTVEQIRARDARFIALTTEAGWATHMEWLFMGQLLSKIQKDSEEKPLEKRYPQALYLALEKIITTTFRSHSQRAEIVASQEFITDAPSPFDLIRDSVSETMQIYATKNPNGRSLQKRVHSLGEALNNYITKRRPATESQIKKYGEFIGTNDETRASPFEFDIVRAIRAIEKIINDGDTKLVERNALRQTSSISGQNSHTERTEFIAPYDHQLIGTLKFLKTGFAGLKDQKGPLYEIANGLFELSKAIRASEDDKPRDTSPEKSSPEKSSLLWNVLARIRNILSKK